MVARAIMEAVITVAAIIEAVIEVIKAVAIGVAVGAAVTNDCQVKPQPLAARGRRGVGVGYAG